MTANKSLDEEGDAVDLITDCMYSTGYLSDISDLTFVPNRDKLTVGQFYDQWLKQVGAPRPIIPFNLGAYLGFLYVGILFAKENWFDLLPDEPFASSDEAWGLRETAVTAPQQAAPTIRHSVKRIRNALGHGHIKVMVREGMKRKELLSKVCVAFHDFDPRKPDDTFDVTLSLENLGKMVKKFQSVIHRHVREKKAAAS